MSNKGAIQHLVIILILAAIVGIIVGVKPIRQKVFRLISKPTTQVTPAPYQAPGGTKNIPAPASIKSDRYGINTGILVTEEPYFNSAIDLVASLGVGWIRLGNDWSDLEPTDNSWNFSGSDRYIDSALSRGINVLYMFDADLDGSFCSAPGKQCLNIGEVEGRKVSGELKTKKAFDAYKLLTGQ